MDLVLAATGMVVASPLLRPDADPQVHRDYVRRWAKVEPVDGL